QHETMHPGEKGERQIPQVFHSRDDIAQTPAARPIIGPFTTVPVMTNRRTGPSLTPVPIADHAPAATSASSCHFTSPPTIVATCRPVSSQPSNGQLRLLLLNCSTSTVHFRFGSIIVISA